MNGARRVIQTRQADDALFSSSTLLAAAASEQLLVRNVDGYGAIKFLAFGDQPFRLRVEQAPTPDGPWVETHSFTSAVNDDGVELLTASILPVGLYMRVFVDNLGAGPMTSFSLTGTGQPIADNGSIATEGGGGGGGGGGPSSIVELKDGGAGATLASVKVDGALIGAGGSVLVGAEDPAGLQQSLQVNLEGALLTADDPGTVITSSPDVAVGIGVTVPLTAPPAGTRRMTVNVTDGDGLTLIRVRELGGVAGSGRQLVLRGSTMFGEAGGAIAPLEVEHEAGAAAAVSISFERD